MSLIPASKGLASRAIRRLVGGGGGSEVAVERLRREMDRLRVLVAQPMARAVRADGPVASLREVEFSVFSQFGEDGILQYLVSLLGVEERSFVEFGVESYREANTRFLLVNDNWRGLVMDGSPEHVESIRSEEIYWRHDLTAVAAFVDRDNIDELLRTHGYEGEIGLLSIDIDGNDYWVWERIETVDPILVVVEYNSVFGAERAMSIPYDPHFRREEAHHPNLYWGASLRALQELGERKGYSLIGCNSNGNNAFFVRRDRLGPLRPLRAAEAYVPSRFRESRDESGQLSYLSGQARIEAIRHLEVFDFELGRTVRIDGVLL
jgi:hypothetical protein